MRGIRKAALGTAGAATLCALSLLVGGSGAIAAPGDAGTGSYTTSSAADQYDATITNTGSTTQHFDYIKATSGSSVTACSIKSGGTKTSQCVPNGAGQGTAEVNFGSAGLPPNGVVVFTFTVTGQIPCGTPLDGGLNSTSDPNQYTIISFPFSGSCGGGGLTNSNFAGVKSFTNKITVQGQKQLIAKLDGNSSSSVDFSLWQLSPSSSILNYIPPAPPPPPRQGTARAAKGVSGGTIAPGKIVKVFVKPKKKLKQMLKSRSKVAVKLKFLFSDSAGHSSSKTEKLTVKR